MRTAWQTFPIEYKGGLISNLAPLQQGTTAPGSATVLQNFEPSVEGGYKKIKGYAPWNEFPIPGTGTVYGCISSAANSAIVVRGGKYYTSTDKADWIERLDLSATAGIKVRHAVFNFNGTTKICMVDGVNKPVFWNSATNTVVEDSLAPSDVQGARRVVNFKNHLFFAKGPNLVFTAPFDELEYSPSHGGGTINVGSPVVGLIVFREQLIVFSLDRIQRIVGNTEADFQLQPIAMNTGTFCGDTVQEVGGDVLYLAPDGIRYLSATERIGDFALARASEAIQNNISSLFADCDNYASVVIRSKSQYRIFRYESELAPMLNRGFLGTRFLDREATGIAWSELRGFKVFTSDSKVYGEKETILFTNTSNFVYEMEFGNSFDGQNIEAIFQTPFVPIEDPRIRKTYYKHTLYVKSEGDFDMSFNLLFDYQDSRVLQPKSVSLKADQSVVFWGSPTTIWGSFIWSNAPRQVYPINTVGSSFTVSLRFYDNSTNPSFSLDTSVLEFKFNDRK
jgi:hypothetical protein